MEGPHTGKHEIASTAPRYNLAGSIPGAIDQLVRIGKVDVRILRHPTPSAAQRNAATEVRERGFVLGAPISTSNDQSVTHSIPESARPLLFDAGSEGRGILSFGDKQLFYELGESLRMVIDVQRRHELIYDGNILEAMALIEFTRPGERSVWFVPGFELKLRPQTGHIDIDAYFSDMVSKSFGQRFERSREIFENSLRGDR